MTSRSKKAKAEREDVTTSELENTAKLGGLARFLNYVAKHHLWVFALLIIPVSLIYDCLWYVRLRISYLVSSGQKNHDQRVADVQRQVRSSN